MPQSQNAEDLAALLGDGLRALRLDRNIDQQALAEQAGVSVTALKNLEGGKGANVSTLVRVLRALGRENWLETIAPVVTINPLTLPAGGGRRQRARKRVAS
ncbi:MAG: helix-turn-helix transcriptional regulator [Gammaproteobacteria bacterium]